MSDRIRILALDPSSTCIGYAEMVGFAPCEQVEVELVAAGRLVPRSERHPANERITDMLGDLTALILEVHPAAIVIEDTSGKVGCRARGRGVNGAGLAVYGKAVGAVWRTAFETAVADARNRINLGILAATASAAPVEMVTENEWTEGVAKVRRASRVAAMFPEYSAHADPGLDVADAIGIGRYWLTRKWPVVRVPVEPPAHTFLMNEQHETHTSKSAVRRARRETR